MRRLLLAASAALAFATPASATEWIYCGTPDNAVSIGVLAGFFEFLNVSAATLRVGTDEWASSPTYGTGAPINVSEAFENDGQILIEMTDEDYNEVLAELRVYTAEEGTDYAQAGVLRVPGRGAWAVTCEGP